MVVLSALSDAETDRLFRALGDATRRDIVRRTLVAEATVSALAEHYAMSWAAVQKHVSVLEGAGLVTKHAHGRERIVRGNPARIQQAQALLDSYEQLWRARIDRLDALLADDT
jgi:DNA-binding transcriptional ArsR family regulator